LLLLGNGPPQIPKPLPAKQVSLECLPQ
jgi:hypothetical protein